MTSDDMNKHKRLFFILIIIFYGLYVLAAVIGRKYLYADGAYYFFRTLTEGGYVYPLGRETFDKLTQLPVVLLANAGCSSIPALGVTYGLSMTVPVALFYFLSIFICVRHNHMIIGEMIFVLSAISLLFTGFFVQIESNMALALFVLELILCLLANESKGIQSVFEFSLLMLLTLVSYHFNEYFAIWSLVLVATILVNIFFERSKGHRLVWIIIIAGQSYIAYSSYLRIADRSGALSWDEIIPRFLSQRVHIIVLTVVATCMVVAAISEFHKIRLQLDVFLYGILGIILMVWIYLKCSAIVLASYNDIRFVNIAFGLGVGIFLVIVYCFVRSDKFQRLYAYKRILLLCVCVAVPVGYYNVRTAREYVEYNECYADFAANTDRIGFVVPEDSEFQYSDYRWFWTVSLNSVFSQIYSGQTDIKSIVVGDNIGFDQYDIESYDKLQQYGISFDVKAFSSGSAGFP